MIAEILITTVITIFLVFIGCLVLGLQISNIKTTLSSQKKAQDATSTSLSSLEKSLTGNIFSLSNVQVDMKKQMYNQGVDIYNAQQGLRGMGSVQQEEVKTRANMKNVDVKMQADLDKVNAGLGAAMSGKAPFSALAVGPATLSRDTRGNLLINTGSNGIVLNASNVSLPLDGSCLGIGMGKLCNTNNTFSLSGNVNSSNIGIADLRVTSEEGKLNIADKYGMSRGVILNGIKQTMPGSMIDYRGYGIGEYENGNMRTYAPSSATSRISMSFKNPDASFKDVVSVKREGMDIAGDVKISGKIDNKGLQQIMNQSQAAQQNATRTMSVLTQAISTLQKSQLLNDASLKAVISATGGGVRIGGDVTITGKITNKDIQQLMQQTQITQQQSANTMRLLNQVIQQLQTVTAKK